MFRTSVVFEQRRHTRVQLHLPVRLRWLGPLGQATEFTETLDVSRGGLLFYRPDPCQLNSRVWVTFPFHPDAHDGQPETMARVVRVRVTPTGGHLVGVAFEEPLPRVTSADRSNQRASPRIPLALSVRVRPSGSPWPEETMTIDVSDVGLQFRTSRHYAVGDTVYVTLPYGPWGLVGEVEARVVHIEPVPGSVEQCVALALIPTVNLCRQRVRA